MSETQKLVVYAALLTHDDEEVSFEGYERMPMSLNLIGNQVCATKANLRFNPCVRGYAHVIGVGFFHGKTGDAKVFVGKRWLKTALVESKVLIPPEQFVLDIEIDEPRIN